MMSIHHTSNSIESEPIKHEDIHVVPQVGKQEPQDFMRTVIEQSRIPKLMSTFSTLMEVEMISTVEHVDSGLQVSWK